MPDEHNCRFSDAEAKAFCDLPVKLAEMGTKFDVFLENWWKYIYPEIKLLMKQQSTLNGFSQGQSDHDPIAAKGERSLTLKDFLQFLGIIMALIFGIIAIYTR